MIEYTARITSQDTPRVGGRNLITRASLWKATTDDGYGWVFESDKDNSIWLSTQRDYPQAKAGDTVTLSLLIRCDKSEWGASEWVIRVADSQGTLKYFYPNKEVFGEFYKHTWTFELRDDGRLPSTQLYNHVWRKDENGRTKFNKRVEAKYTKLEFGTIATDWTPAPEDVAESVSTVNNSLTALASTLLDPEQGEIHKLTDLLDKHKTDTDKNFEELSNHPLTIDDKGYWQIWSVKDSKYLTTQYQSRGDKGDKGEDAGRYLGRAKRIHPDFNGNYLLEPEGSSWQTAKEGDYVYLVGDLSNRGGDKDTYYIVREHKSKTVWEVYNIKGDKPVITLDSQFRLLADGELLSQQSLKGRDGRNGTNGTNGADGKDGEKGADGHTPEIHIGTDYYIYVDGVKQRYIRGQKGEPGHNPTPEEVLGTSRFAELLGGEVTSKVTPLSNEINKSSKYAVDLINQAQLQLCDLQVLGMSDGGVIEVKRQVACCHYDYLTPSIGSETNPPQPPKPKYIKQQIPLTLRSSHDALSRQVTNLQMQLTSYIQQFNRTKEELAQLKADTTITPILNADTRKRGSTLYPRYGDWLLTSDSQEQYISFSGLPASIGKSIYIQTRRKAYLNANGHTFYGLPGTSSSIAVNQWLSNNTTYRFVRADATTWLVTASSSPYPWT